MESILLKNKIDHFWEWFVKHEKQFRKISNPVATRELLNNQVLQFGVFSWEIGKGQGKPHTFTISPNGDAKMLRRSKASLMKPLNCLIGIFLLRSLHKNGILFLKCLIRLCCNKPSMPLIGSIFRG